MRVNLKELIEQYQIEKTEITKPLSIDGKAGSYDVYRIPLKYLYYNDQNGRINTVYHQYIASRGKLNPQTGDSEYNKIFEQFIFDSKKQALKDTQASIREKGQQESGVVLSDGRVIDGNRRFTALRRIERETRISQYFEAVILDYNIESRIDEKKIKELELDLQLGREERVNYDPIDRIFDVYNTIEVQKLMTAEEYKKASGAGNTKGINRDLRLANLIIKFLDIISPGRNPVDKFYLARELKLDGPIEEIERTLNKLKDNKETTTDHVLTTLAVEIAKPDNGDKDITRRMREIKKNILNNPEVNKHYIEATDSHVDKIIDYFDSNPVEKASDLKKGLESKSDILSAANSLLQTTNRLSSKSETASNRRHSLVVLEDIRDNLLELTNDDLKELYKEEFLEAKQILQEIRDLVYKLAK